MYTYDEVLASSFCVFKDGVSTMVISRALEKLSKEDGIRFKRGELKLNKLQELVEFNCCIYKLKDGCNLKTIEKYIRIGLVSLFQEIEEERNKRYEEICSSKGYVKVKK